ncbi:RDD family protein [Lichenibacterium ramalinae]|uniref:RDD family protein n=1 Tax=Lichenibacterium ramalinae TaxID=2316527 RepID=A0A4Q2RCH5_9HYPH|nr:RDD family protein [Lichenibacterium ramalinae]
MAYTTTTTQDLRPAGPAGLPLGMVDGVRRRRIAAVALDLVLVSIVAFGLWLALLVLTFGLSLVILPPLFPFVAFFYNGLTVSGPSMATPGMRLCGLELRTDATGARVPFLNAALHAVLFYFSWTVPPILLVSLVTRDKRCLHDMLSGVIVVRRL